MKPQYICQSCGHITFFPFDERMHRDGYAENGLRCCGRYVVLKRWQQWLIHAIAKFQGVNHRRELMRRARKLEKESAHLTRKIEALNN